MITTSTSIAARLTAVYAAHAGELRGYLARRVRSRADAEDLTQETFLRLYVALIAGETIAQPRGWLFDVARCRLVDAARAGRRRRRREMAAPPVSSGVARPDDALIDRERRDVVRRAWRLLSSFDRRLLAARVNGVKFRVIAADLGLGLQPVAQRVYRAIRTVQRHVRSA